MKSNKAQDCARAGDPVIPFCYTSILALLKEPWELSSVCEVCWIQGSLLSVDLLQWFIHLRSKWDFVFQLLTEENAYSRLKQALCYIKYTGVLGRCFYVCMNFGYGRARVGGFIPWPMENSIPPDIPNAWLDGATGGGKEQRWSNSRNALLCFW